MKKPRSSRKRSGTVSAEWKGAFGRFLQSLNPKTRGEPVDGGEAVTLWKTAWGRHLSGVATIAAARQAAELLMLAGRGLIQQRFIGTMDELIQILIEIAPDPSELLAEVPTPEAMAAYAEEHQFKSLRAVVDSACLISSHAVLEGIVHECLGVSMEQSPDSWDEYYSRKRVTVGSLRNRTQQKIVATLLAEHLEELSRFSLPRKTEILLSKLKPERALLSRGEFPFDIHRLRRIDEKRHSVVHEGIRELSNLDDDLRFLDVTAGRLLGLNDIKISGSP